jgi:adenylate cyclase class 2
MGQLEVELKFAALEGEELTKRLVLLGARQQGEVIQADEYLAHPARDFAVTDEALRIRRQGDRRVLTYKGPKAKAAVKIREEVEADFSADQDAAITRIFQHLGFRSVAIVAKRRRSWMLEFQGQALKVEVDEVQQLGQFVEIEALAEVDQVPAAEQAILNLAQELGLQQASQASYLALLLGQSDD